MQTRRKARKIKPYPPLTLQANIRPQDRQGHAEMFWRDYFSKAGWQERDRELCICLMRDWMGGDFGAMLAMIDLAQESGIGDVMADGGGIARRAIRTVCVAIENAMRGARRRPRELKEYGAACERWVAAGGDKDKAAVAELVRSAMALIGHYFANRAA